MSSIIIFLDSHSRSNLLEEIQYLILSDDLAISIPPEIVAEALSHLKSGKYDGSKTFTNHSMFATPVLQEVLSSLFISASSWLHAGGGELHLNQRNCNTYL